MSENKTTGPQDKPEKKGWHRTKSGRVVKAVGQGLVGVVIEESIKDSVHLGNDYNHHTGSSPRPQGHDESTEVGDGELLDMAEDSRTIEAIDDSVVEQTYHVDDRLEADLPDTSLVSLIDPGQSDVNDLEVGDAEWVDSLPTDFMEFGETVPQLLLNSIGFATPEEMVSADLVPALNAQWMMAEVYQILPSDTLSEIALSHGISVENLLSLNPHIENPNLIYAGTELIVPSVGESSDSPSDFLEVELAETSDILEAELHLEEQSEVDFESIDWDYFETHESGNYQSALENIDFDDFESPGSYMDDGFGEADWGDFDASLGFR